MSERQLKKIVSGGQTGVDRAALDVAVFLDIEHGGWCPLGRRAEDGPIPENYQLTETQARDYAIRTEKNVTDSDGTLILYRQRTTGGTELTRRLAQKWDRPLLCIDLDELESGAQEVLQANFQDWLNQHAIQVLNVAGPRESSCPGISQLAERILVELLRPQSENS